MAKKLKQVSTIEIEKKALIEAIKLMIRLYIFSVVPLLLGILLTGINTETGAININWLVFRNIFLYQTILFVIAGLDKFKHEYLKAKNPKATKGKSLGIVKF